MEAARELYLFAMNDFQTYENAYKPTTKNMARKIARGTFDKEKAVIAFDHVATFAAKRYAEEFCSVPYYVAFSVATRRATAEMILSDFMDGIQ